MPISQVNGVPWESITQYIGVLKANISKIAGEDKPSVGPTCSTVSFGYSDGNRNPPSDACLSIPQNYDFDSVNQLLYISGGCGTTFAIRGYYSDGREIFYWNGIGGWAVFNACDKEK
jgi:hypothetical protein